MGISAGRILWHDDDFLAVQKLSRELAVKGKGPVQKLPLLDFLRKEEPGLHPVHRLDFETSGVLLLARSRRALRAARDMQDKGGWVKTYRMFAWGRLQPSGEIRKPLPARSGRGKVDALTRYKVLKPFEDISLVEAQILTGRHHQIRKHFAGIGHPLVLDALYGDKKKDRAFSRAFRYHHFFLHASSLEFRHPFTGKTVWVEAPLPRAFEEVLERLE